MTAPRLPKLLVKCEDCDWEGNCHPPEMVAWSLAAQKWLCDECWSEYETYNEERDEYTVEAPTVFAKDALDSADEQLRRLTAAAAARRLGV